MHVARSGPASHIACLVAVLGCGSEAVTLPPDAGADAPKCSGQAVCQGLVLRACSDGVIGAQIDDCSGAGACSSGRCLSPACMIAERDRTGFAGCLFYTVEVDNVDSDDALSTSLLVTNPGREAAVAVLQQPGFDGAWNPIAQAPIAGGRSIRLLVPDGHETVPDGLRVAGALRIWSNRPVTVEQVQSDDTNESALSSGGTILLPVHVLGSHYRVMAYRQVGTAAVTATVGGNGGAGRLIIVGTEAGTGVTLTAARGVSALISGALPLTELMLGDGDVFQAWTGDDGDDLSGTEITTTHPVAVFSGNITTTYGMTAPGIHSPDMAHEQLPPIYAWSQKYVAARLPPQAGTCDSLLVQPDASLWRILSASDLTEVEFKSPDGAAPIRAPVTMSAGEVLDVIASGDFVVSASGPVLVTQGIDCEPSLSLAISADKLHEDVTFAVLPSFDQVITVARQQGQPVMLDGEPIDEALFSSAGGGYEVARVLLLPCPSSQQVCTHRLEGRFGMTLRGMDVLASYATTVPAWANCLDPTESMCVN